MKDKGREDRANDSIDKVIDKLLKDFFSKPNNRKTNARGAGDGKATI